MDNITFKNTEHAIEYGKSIKGNKEALENLNDLRAYYVGKVAFLMEQGKHSEALFLASGQSQLSREALEEATK
jgi:hypothetical protein